MEGGISLLWTQIMPKSNANADLWWGLRSELRWFCALPDQQKEIWNPVCCFPYLLPRISIVFKGKTPLCQWMISAEFNRSIGGKHEYLGLLWSKVVNLRCDVLYARDEVPLDGKELIQREEIGNFCRDILWGFGVKKIRLTGRLNFISERLCRLRSTLVSFPCRNIITTKRVCYCVEILSFFARSGIKHVDFSLDTLRKPDFWIMTVGNGCPETMENFLFGNRGTNSAEI